MIRYFAIVYLFVSLFAFTPAYAAEKEAVNLDVGIIIQNKVLVPIRDIFEVLGLNLHWDATNQMITAEDGKTKISLKIGNTSVIVNNQTIAIDVPAQIKDGKTFVPLRFISEAFGAKVTWDNPSKTALISTEGKDIYVISHYYFEINGEKFVYDGSVSNGLPNGYGTAIKGTSFYGEMLYEGQWKNGKPYKNIETAVEKKIKADPSRASLDTSSTLKLVDNGTIHQGMTKEEIFNLLGSPHTISIVSEPVPNTEIWNYHLQFKRAGLNISTYLTLFFNSEGKLFRY